MGALPSQHPPDRWNMIGPCAALSSSINSRAASDTVTRSSIPRASKEAERLGAVAHQDVLGLLVMIEHHLVSLAPDSRLLVAAECGVRRIGVIAVGPDTSRLDAAAEAVRHVDVARPYAGAQPVKRIVRNFERLLRRIKGSHGHHRSEDLLLENAHLVVALEHRRLDVEAGGELARELVRGAAGQHFRALLLADVDIGQDL